MIEITNFKANYGDTFLIEIHKVNERPVTLLIDCGFGFKTGALPVLEKLGERDIQLDKFIVTHYDSDHIASAYSFIKNNGPALKPNIITIKEIWLNTFRHLQFSKRASHDSEENKLSQKEAALTSFKPTEIGKEGEIGAKQALLLGRLLLEFGYSWNSDFLGKAAMAPAVVNIDDLVKMTLLTPNKENLKALESEFIDKLEEFKLKVNDDAFFDDAFELFNLQQSELKKKKEGPISAISNEVTKESIQQIEEIYEYDPDDASGNGSSISLLIEAEDRKLLFLADAHAEDIITALELKYPEKKDYPLFFDVIKVAHHGSFRNNSPELLRLIDSDKWIFSTNGKHPKHQHPDFATIAHIVRRTLPKNKLKRTLYFNYAPSHLLELGTKELTDFFNYEIKIQSEIRL